jgi:hypothetical protein
MHRPPPKDMGWVDLGLSGEDRVGPVEEIRASVEEPAHQWRSLCGGGGAHSLVEELARPC